MAELRVPLYVHPGPPMLPVHQAYYGGFGKEITARLSLFGWGWHSEAGVHVIRLILSGILDRFPGLMLISGHWGEMVPFFLQRLDDTMPQGITGLSRNILETYRDQVYVTPSGMLHLPQFRFCREILGPERILFSLDYPYLSMTGARAWLNKLPISDAERIALAGGSAARLFGRGLAS
jgi:predicted TIM-barrel fold metal-dependent hydrolase